MRVDTAGTGKLRLHGDLHTFTHLSIQGRWNDHFDPQRIERGHSKDRLAINTFTGLHQPINDHAIDRATDRALPQLCLGARQLALGRGFGFPRLRQTLVGNFVFALSLVNF